MVIDQLKVYSREHRFVADVAVPTHVHFNIFVRLPIFTLLILTGCNEETQNANTSFLNFSIKGGSSATLWLAQVWESIAPLAPLNHYHMMIN